MPFRLQVGTVHGCISMRTLSQFNLQIVQTIHELRVNRETGKSSGYESQTILSVNDLRCCMGIRREPLLFLLWSQTGFLCLFKIKS